MYTEISESLFQVVHTISSMSGTTAHKGGIQPIGVASRPKRIKRSPYEDDANKPRKVLIYVRVSTEEQAQGQSLSEQERQCREFISREKPNWQVVGVYEDHHTGKTVKRSGFQAMLNAIEEGKGDAIVCHHLDRFSRKLEDILTYFKWLEDRESILTFANDRFDFSTPEGRLMFHILAVFAEWYIDNLAREVRKGKFGRVVKQQQNNLPPFGYIRRADGEDVIVPEEAEAIREAFELYAAGSYTDQLIANFLNERGFRTRKGKEWGKDSVRDFLQRDFYYGVVKYHGDLYPGKHEPIVSKELFDKAYEVRKKHAKAPRTFSQKKGAKEVKDAKIKRVYMLNGIIRCAHCGRNLRAQGSEKYLYYREVSHLRGYQCDYKGSSVLVDAADEQVSNIIQAFHLPEDWKQEIQKQLTSDDERDRILRKRKAIEERLVRIAELYESGSYDRKTYDEKRTEAAKELSELVLPSTELAIDAGYELETFQDIWPAATKEERREMCQLMIEAVEYDFEKHQVVRMKPADEFRWFFENHELLEKDLDNFVRVKRAGSVNE